MERQSCSSSSTETCQVYNFPHALCHIEEEEKKALLPLPVAGYRSYTEREAAVGRDGYIQYSCAFYSVPPQYIKRKVIARDYEGRLYIYDDHRTLIAEHPVFSG